MSEKNQNNNSKRPLSPHLTIYKPQITSVLSISHRLTGLALFVGTLILAWWIILSIYGNCDCINQIITSTPVRFFLVLWTLALYYHLLNGIRHLFWDMGKGFEIETVNKSGILVILGAVGLTLSSWFYVL